MTEPSLILSATSENKPRQNRRLIPRRTRAAGSGEGRAFNLGVLPPKLPPNCLGRDNTRPDNGDGGAVETL